MQLRLQYNSYDLRHNQEYIIICISGHVCDVLCINASVLATRKDPGQD
jgi:hypothetical protein